MTTKKVHQCHNYLITVHNYCNTIQQSAQMSNEQQLIDVSQSSNQTADSKKEEHVCLSNLEGLVEKACQANVIRMINLII